ncbi:cobyric acid synthase [Vibrio halioticoli NBRC 102217]|uniref:Cobyric acid synthase n=1 Tax=Vibrio halioticoli NBRC 102217 TaxID=1219072 RepID=V5FR83_9VIBR|nr:cobyric acid synthase [Vibrio halioticoli]GAD91177.1 cobyric acid synthase [Vibrio halioticoli NBRC 102217]
MSKLHSAKNPPQIRGSLMVQGTTSDAGKSTLVAGLCRLFTRLNYNVAPFKPQNMALNSAVTIDGGEIGRAQALQAIACHLPLHTDFNPVLLKPSSDTGSQVIIQGKALTTLEAKSFFGPESEDYKSKAMAAVMDSYARLQQQYDMVLIEGAGSPAEINLRQGDIANMGFAEKADCPVIIIADIDKGGVFAHLVGTIALLSESEQARVKGFVINRFRGDISLLQSGIDWLEEYTQKPVLGVLPYLHDLHLDAEDALIDDEINQTELHNNNTLNVLVLVFPRISNHTDFDPLRLHPQVNFRYITLNDDIEQAIQGTDLIIVPGSKNVRADLAFMKEQGWDEAINRHLRYGGKVMGICGGYQMLGQEIDDPDGIEDIAGCSQGLGLLPAYTQLKADKTLSQVQGELQIGADKVPFQGYEIHCGETIQRDDSNLLTELAPISFESGITDGMLSADQRILATYVHGIFDSPQACQLLLKWAGLKQAQTLDINLIREQQLERLADILEEHLDMDKLSRLIQ